MINWRERYNRWMNYPDLDERLREELQRAKDNEPLLEDLFYADLEFGTGGMRAEMGPGPNRMNVYTVRKISEGLARFIAESGQQAKAQGVVIAYDSRNKSSDFAIESAKVIGRHGIRVYLFDRLCPTPLLSFAVRHLHAFAGIVITASHNPPEYNGYKIYGSDGVQITPATAEQIMAKVNEVTDELSVESGDEASLRQSGLLVQIHDDILEAYVERLQTIRLNPEPSGTSQVNIVFTPLHGTAYEPIRLVLSRFGYNQVTVVTEQANPDPHFTNAASLNPEEPQAFELALQYGKRTNADLILATDPDADRIGVAVKKGPQGYTILSGNQIGALLLDYLLSERKRKGLLPDNGTIVKTIVTSEFARAIAADYGVDTVDTLTGFKYIGEKISMYERSGQYTFLFGFEESSGYLIGDFVRDKDGIQTALMLADMCAFHKSSGKSIYDGLIELYKRYGFYSEDLYSLSLKGKAGVEKIRATLSFFRQQGFTEVAGKKVMVVEDFLAGTCREMVNGTSTAIPLPASDVLKYRLDDESWFCLRPSGTEPKLKVYLGTKGVTSEESSQKLRALKNFVLEQFNALGLI
ncbi:phosphoglucomutase [Brevibacillus borstelensis]|nr:phosphoglucomutase [Brevibacillus borstelensis]